MDLDLNAVRAFVLVVEAGGVTEGARRAGLPKSTVSRQLQDLQARLGVALLERRGRGLGATVAGRRLYDSARSSIAALEALRQDAVAAPVSGRVEVAAPVTLARGPLAEVIPGFLARHPAISVAVTMSDRFTAAEAPDADIAFQVGAFPAGGAAREPVGVVEARLYAAPALLGAVAAPRVPADLPHLPTLAQGCEPGGRARWTLTDPHGDVHGIAFTPRLVCADPDMLVAAAVAGLGVCRLATFVAQPHVRAGRLVPVLARHVAERHEVAVVTLRRPRDRAVRLFATEAATWLRAWLAMPPEAPGYPEEG